MADLFRALVEATPDAVVVADREGRILLWNTGAERIFGHRAEDALGSSLDLIIPERQRARHWEGYASVMAKGETRYGDRLLAVPAMREDGARISVEFSVGLIRGEGGEVASIVAIMRDVSERWERERARDRSRQVLG